MAEQFKWVRFYTEFAIKLLEYKKYRHSLIEKLQTVYSNVGIKLPKLEKDSLPKDIDPFSVFGLFNKGITDANRISILAEIKSIFSVSVDVPDDFSGVPVLNNMKAIFYAFEGSGKRKDDDIDNLWDVFESAICLAKDDTEKTRGEFSKAYDKAILQYAVKWNLTMGLYWICPQKFINLDVCNRKFMSDPYKISEDVVVEIKKLKSVPSAEKYLNICDKCKAAIVGGEYGYASFPELSHKAWTLSLKNSGNKSNKAVEHELYSIEDFLREVYMDEESYNKLVGVLENKLNIILQGAPGVGKTFVAMRLAYSIMGVKDVERVMMVQFHQSYSYEDFIMGFRPSSNGFNIKTGAFYNFCKKAEKDSDNKYFFIIDEINRGNLSRIFGELFMLVENDKRGEKNKLQLLYRDEMFYVPENIYIIGMMNTADRSLAMLDYALRRRFAFFNLNPGFLTEGFCTYRKGLDNKKFDELIKCVENLNDKIAEDESLGEGFCIGHSYFCNMEKADITDARLQGIIEYELIPMLKEYWFDEPLKVKEWSDNLRNVFK